MGYVSFAHNILHLISLNNNWQKLISKSLVFLKQLNPNSFLILKNMAMTLRSSW